MIQTIIRLLLPRDRRDQIVGDLHERGFRLSDVASVLPRVWWSHIHRAVTGPVPHLAAAGEGAILARTEQLQRQGRFTWALAQAVVIWAFALNLPDGASRFWFVATSLGGLAVASRLRRWPQPALTLDRSRRTLLADYGTQINFQLTLLAWMPLFCVFTLFLTVKDPIVLNASLPAILLTCSVSAILIAWPLCRAFQLRRERDSLRTAQQAT